MTVANEDLRAEMLLDAQDKAARLFAEIERSGMVRAGVGEKALSDEIRDLAAEMFGVERPWHKRVVRSGHNTLQPYRENPPDRLIAAEFPNETIAGDRIESYIAPGSDHPMRRTGRTGRVCHWISRCTSPIPSAGSAASTRSCSTWRERER